MQKLIKEHLSDVRGPVETNWSDRIQNEPILLNYSNYLFCVNRAYILNYENPSTELQIENKLKYLVFGHNNNSISVSWSQIQTAIVSKLQND